MGLCLLSQASMPFNYWWEVFSSSVFVINRLLTAVLDFKSPCQVLFNKIHDYAFLKVFGCSCFPLFRPYNSHKFNFHTRNVCFLAIVTVINVIISWTAQVEFILPRMSLLIKMKFFLLLVSVSQNPHILFLSSLIPMLFYYFLRTCLLLAQLLLVQQFLQCLCRLQKWRVLA